MSATIPVSTAGPGPPAGLAAPAPALMLVHMTVRLYAHLVLAAQLFVWASGGVHAAEAPTEAAEARSAVLDTLFEDLAGAGSAEDAKAVESAIFKVWMQSGSPSVDLLMGHGLDALAEKDLDRAHFYFNEVVLLAPDFVEGWDKRAAVSFVQDDYASALKDIERVLALEPRHFGAMGGLALILRDLGDKKGALEVYRRVLKIYPRLPGAAEAERSLSLEVEGRGI